MNDLVSLFRNFIYRDLAFIIGGSIVIVSTLHAFGISLHRLQDQPYTLFLLTVLAYVVGYAVQDLGALLPCRPTFTGYVLRPGRLSRFLYWRFTNSGWEPLTFARNQEEALQLAIRLNKPKAVPKPILRELERIRSLKVFSMCVGALAADTGGAKEPKRRTASGALIGQAQPSHNVTLRGLERLRWSLLRDVLAGCIF
jgi:hypothetical protein